jgi:excinuclease ABC subunit C
VEELTTPELYANAVRDAQLFLEGRSAELERTLAARMAAAAEAEQFEAAARLRDQLSTVHQLHEKQRIATAEQDDDADVFGYHFEASSLAVNLFHVRAGKIVDRREFFWEDLPDLLETVDSAEVSEAQFHAGPVFSALLKQLYIDQHYVPRTVLLPVEFDDRESLSALLSERTGHRIEIAVPLRGEKRSLVDLAGQNAKQSYTQRFRVLEPSRKAIQEALADALMLPELPKRIECFDISHIQGAETVASLVVWEDGKMNKQLYRKFKVMTVLGVDDFASMREVVHRRYRRLQEEGKAMPSLILIDGGLGQLHAAAEALESLGITSQPLASIAKREEVIYLYGNEEEPVVLDRRSPVLHLVQLIRDESHRFAVGYHRQRRAMRDRDSELLNIPGVGPQTRQRLLSHFGSLRDVRQASVESLAAVVPRKTAEKIRRHFEEAEAGGQAEGAAKGE